MVEVTIPLSDEQVRAVRHELSEPYGQQVRAGIFDTLRTVLDQPAAQQQEVDGAGDELREAAAQRESAKDRNRREADAALGRRAALQATAATQPTKETYTREQLLSDEALDAAGSVRIETTYPFRTVDRQHRREVIEAVCDANDSRTGDGQ